MASASVLEKPSLPILLMRRGFRVLLFALEPLTCSSLLFTAYRTIASNVSILRARAIYSDIGQRMTLSRSSRPICRCGYEDKLPLQARSFPEKTSTHRWHSVVLCFCGLRHQRAKGRVSTVPLAVGGAQMLRRVFALPQTSDNFLCPERGLYGSDPNGG